MVGPGGLVCLANVYVQTSTYLSAILLPLVLIDLVSLHKESLTILRPVMSIPH